MAVAGDGALADDGGELELGDVFDVDGRAGVGVVADDDLADFVERIEETFAADEVLLALVGDVAAADVAVVRLEGGEDVGNGDVVGDEAFGTDGDLVGLELTAEGVDLDDAGDAAQLEVDVPIEDRAQLHGRVPVAFDLELVDFAEAGRDRPHGGFAVAFGDGVARFGKAFADELASPVDVGAFVEDDGDDGEAEFGDGSDLFDFGEAAHGGLDGERDELLDLFGRESGGIGEDLDLDVGDVGDGVDGELDEGVDADGGDEQPEDNDEEAVVEGEIDDFRH